MSGGPEAILGWYRDESIAAYPERPPFNPPEHYPELPRPAAPAGPATLDPTNRVYPAMRELFIRMGLDRGRIGTPEWNPLGLYVRPGDRVVIKPNLVTDKHYLGDEGVRSSIVHGSVLRPLVDYVAKALEGRGSIVIADNPIIGADFDHIMRQSGIRAMAEGLLLPGGIRVEVLDLRPRVIKRGPSGEAAITPQEGDPLGYASIDLGGRSCFGELDARPEIHYYTLADPTVDHMDPSFRGRSETDEYHGQGQHRYLVSRTVLSADVIFSVAKLKTHAKAGATLSLKNMIGIVNEKHCMPHHRPGPPPEGDAFPAPPPAHYVWIRRKLRDYKRRFGFYKLPLISGLVRAMKKRRILFRDYEDHGSWRGNDTIWRTILDLNRIVAYSDPEGRMQDAIQRRTFSIIDGIVAQEGDGPLRGTPRPCGMLLAGGNPVLTDALALKAMGLPLQTCPTITKAAALRDWPLIEEGDWPEEGDLALPGADVPDLGFALPSGWRIVPGPGPGPGR